MRRDADAQVQVAGGTAAAPGFALAGDPDARPVADARRDPHVHRSHLSVQPHRQTAKGAVIRVFESELQLLLDIPSGATPRRAPAALRAAAHLAAETRATAATEEGLEEVGERAPVAEHLAHFLFGHRAVAAARRLAAEAHVPAWLTAEAGSAGSARRHVLVRAPVRAQLV